MNVGNFILTQKQQDALAFSHRLQVAYPTGMWEALLEGGSRSGKTALITAVLILCCLKYPGIRFLVIRKHLQDIIRAILHDTFPKVCSLFSPYLKPDLNKKDYFHQFHNGSEIWYLGLANATSSEKALGNEYAGLFFNECTQISYEAYGLAKTRLAQNIPGFRHRILADCNPTHRGFWAYKHFVQKLNAKDGSPLPFPDSIGSFRMNPADNRVNLPEGYIEHTLGSLSKREQLRFKEGRWADEVEGALWKIDYIKYAEKPKSFERVVIAVDPATTSKTSSDETGIIVAGLSRDKAYILEDASGKYTPKKWAEKVEKLFHEFQCDVIVVETNNGGDLVTANLKSVGVHLPIRSIHAKRGKVLRAEPVVALYEHEKILHVGAFPDLEAQMISWCPQDEDSPDRIDALVYAIFELMLKSIQAKFYVG